MSTNMSTKTNTNMTISRKASAIAGDLWDDRSREGTLAQQLRTVAAEPDHGTDGDLTENDRIELRYLASVAETLPLAWSEGGSDARVSVSDGVTTVYLTEDDIPGDTLDFEEIAKSYAHHYDHNGNESGYVIAEITDMQDGDSWDFRFDGHGDFQWDVRA